MAEKSSDYLGGSRASAAARVLGDLLTAHYKEGSSMAALVDVRVETASSLAEDGLLLSSTTSSAGSHSAESDSYVVAIVCAILAGLVIVAGLLVLLLWRLRKRPDQVIGPSNSNSASSADGFVSEKALNNLQNEENLRLQQQRRRSAVVMKTLNVSELPDNHGGGLPSAKNKILALESSVGPPVSAVLPDSSSFIYKAPSVIDLRNNMSHLQAAKAGLLEK